MNAKKMIVEIRYRDKAYASIRSDTPDTTLSIGSGPDNNWISPVGDRTMMPHHAKLELKNGVFTLAAGAGLAFRVHAEPRTVHTLILGDRISIGDSEIFVSKTNDPVLYAEFDRLEPLGKGNLPFIPVKGSPFRIGSAAEADLRLANSIVSASHAEIETRENGEVWIRDLKSRNGTKVNGQRLGANARLLFDSDVISIGADDFRFLSKLVQHVRARTGRNLILGILTLASVLAVWCIVFLLTPDALQNIRHASALAAVERFDDGLRALDDARSSRGFEQNHRLWTETQESLNTWKTAHDIWQEFKDHLAKSEWREAQECLGRLDTDKRQSWNWNPQQTDSMLNEISTTRRDFLLLQSINRAIESPNWTDDDNPALERKIAAAGAGSPDFTDAEKESRTWIRPLKNELAARLTRMRENERIHDEINRRLESFSPDKPENIDELESYLEKSRIESTGHVRLFAHALKKPLSKIRQDIQRIQADESALGDLDFEKFKRLPIETTPDDCSLAPALSKRYQHLLSYRKRLNAFAERMLEALTILAANEASLTKDPTVLVEFEDEKAVQSALDCKILNHGKPPHRGRTKPVDDYDRLFGFECLWAYLSQGSYAFPAELEPREILTGTFQPCLLALHDLCRSLDTIHVEMTAKENNGFIKGKVITLKQHIEDILARYEKIRQGFKTVADAEKDSRKGIIARGAYLYLTPHKEITKADWEIVKSYLDRLKAKQKKLADEIDPTQPDKARKIIGEILRNGIPGAPTVIKAMNNR